MVWKIDRLGHSLSHLLEIIADRRERGIAFRCLTKHLDTATAQVELLCSMFGALA